MKEKLTALDFDGLTMEITERPLSAEEVAERNEIAANLLTQKVAVEQARESALAKLAALGLTEAEIAAL